MKNLCFVSLLLLLLFSCQENELTPDRTGQEFSSNTGNKIPAIIQTDLINPQVSFDSHVERYHLLKPVKNAGYESQVIELTNTQSKMNKVFQVYPTGNYPEDRDNLQLLVDELGASGQDATIFLKATDTDGHPAVFNFGFSDGSDDNGARVFIVGNSGSLKFKGEQAGEHMTTIEGGVRFPNISGGSFFIYLRPDDDILFQGIKFINEAGIMVRNVGNMIVRECHFMNTTIAFDSFGESHSTTLQNNTFTDLGIAMRNFNDNKVLTIAENTMSNAVYGSLNFFVEGKIVIKENYITGNGTPEISAHGIDIVPTVNTDAEIKDNYVSGSEIIATQVYTFLQPGENVTIKNNTYQTDNLGPWSAVAIVAVGGALNNVTVKNNIIGGMASTAFWVAEPLSVFPAAGISDLVIRDNSLTDFSSNCQEYDDMGVDLGCVDIYFGSTTTNIEYCGETENLIDQGTNNLIKDEC